METPLYHYCSNETFLNILKNKTIRLSDISKSNDYKETKWLVEYIEDEIIQRYKEDPFFRGQLIYGLDEIDALKLITKSIKERMLERNDALFYGACFSEKGDKLSQWRGYADDGHGISIGFNYESLAKLISEEESINLFKIEYPDENNESALAQIKKHSEDIIGSILYAINTNDSKKLFSNDTYAIDVFHELSSRIFIQESIKFKNPAFKEEAEWRIVFDDEIDKYINWEDWYDGVEEKSALSDEIATLFPNGLQFRALRNKIISFFDLSFKSYEQTIINEIVIGPKSDVQEGDVYQLLAYYGYDPDIKIVKSKSTYR